jgi:hypothetical protein
MDMTYDAMDKDGHVNTLPPFADIDVATIITNTHTRWQRLIHQPHSLLHSEFGHWERGAVAFVLRRITERKAGVVACRKKGDY